VKTFIGTKIINAKPMTRADYNLLRGWETPFDESGDDEGYLVEYLDGGTPNVEGYDNSISWSPKDVFENSYRPVQGMSFSAAVEALKKGEKVTRAGWNGKGMWVALGGGNPAVPADQLWNKHTKAFAHENGGTASVLPYLIMKTAKGEILMGWLASQTDIISEDWEIVP
jgi:hypothetical protein